MRMTNIKKNMTAEEVYERITGEMDEVSPVFLSEFLADMLAEPVEEWSPEVGEKYWFIDSEGRVAEVRWDDEGFDRRVRSFLGVYPTRQAAEEALQEIKSKLGK
jgi:hypothetical protein